MNTFRPLTANVPRYQRSTASRPTSYIYGSPTRPSPMSAPRPSTRPPPRPLSGMGDFHASQSSVNNVSLVRSPVKRTIRQVLV